MTFTISLFGFCCLVAGLLVVVGIIWGVYLTKQINTLKFAVSAYKDLHEKHCNLVGDFATLRKEFVDFVGEAKDKVADDNLSNLMSDKEWDDLLLEIEGFSAPSKKSKVAEQPKKLTNKVKK